MNKRVALFFDKMLAPNKLDPNLVTCYIFFMRIISKKILRDFWAIHPDAEQPLKAWHAKTKLAEWKNSSDIKIDDRNASFVANNRVIFNIKGNTYRLVAAINYDYSVIYIRFVGKHRDYEKIDAATI